MSAILDRFCPPGANDELAYCQNCSKIVHYTELDDEGFCYECEPEPPIERHIEIAYDNNESWPICVRVSASQ